MTILGSIKLFLDMHFTCAWLRLIQGYKNNNNSKVPIVTTYCSHFHSSLQDMKLKSAEGARMYCPVGIPDVLIVCNDLLRMPQLPFLFEAVRLCGEHAEFSNF